MWVQSLGREEDPLEREMATHSSILAWRIPWTEEPGGLQTIGSHRVGRNLSNLAQHMKNITKEGRSADRRFIRKLVTLKRHNKGLNRGISSNSSKH